MLVFSIVPFDNKKQARDGFDCRTPVLNQYLAQRAGQDMLNKYATVFVAPEAETNRVLGYYTLSSVSVCLDEPTQYGDVPASLLGRLAVLEGFIKNPGRTVY